MDLRYSAEDLAFRDEVRTFVRENLPGHIRDKVAAQQHLSKDDYVTGRRSWPAAAGWRRTGRGNGAAATGRRSRSTSSTRS